MPVGRTRRRSSFLGRTAGTGGGRGFGSAHANSFNMAFCDGSVQSMSYNIDTTVHRYLGSRNDGQIIDGAKF
jgi:prepilin-type processing-associated H-X9-DG protein